MGDKKEHLATTKHLPLIFGRSLLERWRSRTKAELDNPGHLKNSCQDGDGDGGRGTRMVNVQHISQ